MNEMYFVKQSMLNLILIQIRQMNVVYPLSSSESSVVQNDGSRCVTINLIPDKPGKAGARRRNIFSVSWLLS